MTPLSLNVWLLILSHKAFEKVFHSCLSNVQVCSSAFAKQVEFSTAVQFYLFFSFSCSHSGVPQWIRFILLIWPSFMLDSLIFFWDIGVSNELLHVGGNAFRYVESMPTRHRKDSNCLTWSSKKSDISLKFFENFNPIFHYWLQLGWCPSFHVFSEQNCLWCTLSSSLLSSANCYWVLSKC